MRLTALFALCLIAAPALADCVTPDDLAKGVAFKRQDGHRGIIQGGAVLAVDYASDSTTAWMDKRKTKAGIYEIDWSWTPTDEYYVGGGPGGYYEYKLSGKAPEPAAGTDWKTKVKVTEWQDYGLETGPEKTRYAYDAVFSFQAEKEVKLSGCPYRIIPVEATFSGKNAHFTRRWVYFTELGFGLETRTIDHQTGEDRKLGLTEMKPVR